MKKISLLLLGFAVAGLPVLVSAQGVPASSTTNGFCTGLTQRLSGLNQSAAGQINKLGQDAASQSSNFESKWNDFEANRQKADQNEDADLATRVQKLTSLQTTDASKQAVANFQAAVESALQAKRGALNAALQTFHDGLASLMSQRNSSVESAFTARLNAFKAAEQKAESDCAAGVASRTVRTNLIAALKTAQSNFAAARKANSDFQANMKDLVDAKNAAIRKAQADFQTAVQAARDALKAALGESQATSTESTSTGH